jgi:hypothetical protein
VDRSTKLWVGVIVLAGLAGAVYFQAKRDAKVGIAQTSSADLPEIKVPEDIDKITITNADKGEIVLEKKGDNWMLSKPLEALANQANVKSLIDNMKDLKAKEVIIAAPNDELLKDYQFDAAHAVKVVAFKGGEKKLDASFGKSGARGQMAQIDGKKEIFSVGGYSSYLYARDLKAWRNTEVFKFDDTAVSNFTIENAKASMSFTKGEGDKWAATNKGQPIARLNEEKIKDVLRTFKMLNAEDFGDGKAADATGLDAPEGTVTINLKDNAGKYVLKVGKTSTGTSRFAQKEGSDTIFVIGGYSTDWAVAEPAKFQKLADGGVEKPETPPPGMGGMPPGMGGMPPGMRGMPAGHPGADPHGH